LNGVSRTPLRAAPFVALSFLLLWSFGQVPVSGSSEPDIQRVLARFNTSAPPAYRAFRRMDAGLTDSESRQGWLEVFTEFTPGRGLTFEVVREGGSDYVRNKVLRRLLESEQDLLANGKPLRASLEPKNYNFEDGGATDDGLQRVVLKAARKSDGIVNGSLFVNPETGYVTRMEGRLVKSPSFWVRDVDVVWKFAHLAGHIVPVEMTTTGRVRMFGRSNFKMVYDYVSVDGQSSGLPAPQAFRQ